ncbi:MAG: prepilin-type N-terminal cleavage/methylation domain-containing protein [Lachnospiraceae bacterium]|nr:prepilin-type N-terminal cleavage/methylation domain-containing protein [Lachnospiraceae bacterium]
MNTKLNDKGFSLVELLVAMAIAAIVSTLIISMMISSTSMFKNENEQIDLQNELQIVQNQLTEKFMEAKAINVVKCGDDVRIYTGEIDINTNKLLVESEAGKHTECVITYTDGKLYLTGKYMDSIPDGYLLSENVLDFDIDIATVPGEEEMIVKNEDNSYSTVTRYFYDNPISIKLTLKIGTEKENKTDELVLKIRNKIDDYRIYSVSSFNGTLAGVKPTELDLR